MTSPRPRAPLLSPSALGHLQTDATTRPQGQGLEQMQAQAAVAGARSPWLGASQPHSGLASEGGSPTLDDDGEGGIEESGEWAEDGGYGHAHGQPDGEGSQPKRERRPMQTVIDGQQQQDDVVVSQGGGAAAPSGRARPATGRDHGNAKRRRREAAQADGSEESSSSGGGGRGGDSGSGSRSSRSSSGSQSSSTSSSSDSDGDERRDEDPAAAAARRSRQGRLLQNGHPMDVEAEAAEAEAEAAAAAAQSAPNQPLFHCVTTNIDLILQLLHAVKLEKKEQVSAASLMPQFELFV